MKNKFFNFIKILVSVVLLYILLSRANLNEMYTALTHVRVEYYLLSILLYFIAILLSSVRWMIILKEKSIQIPLIVAVKFYLISLFMGIFLPSGGLDVVRALYASRYGTKSEVFAATVIDRLSGFYGILIYILLGFFILPEELIKYRNLIGITLLIVFLFNILIFFRQVNELINKKLPDTKVLLPIKKFINSMYFYRGSIPLLLKILPLSLSIQATFAISAIIISHAIIAPVPVLRGLFYVPLINFLAMIPVTIAGLGLREGGFVYFFKSFISTESALLLSLLYYIASIVISVPGFLLFLLDKPSENLKKLNQ